MNNSAHFIKVDGRLEIRYKTEGIAPVFAEKWFQQIRDQYEKNQARFTKTVQAAATVHEIIEHRVMPVEVAPLTVNTDISDAEASQIIHEQLEKAAAIVEQDAMYAAEIANKCAAIAEFGLQVIDALQVGDEWFSWHKSAYDKQPAMWFAGYVMTPPDEYGRIIVANRQDVTAAPRVVELSKQQAPFYVARNLYHQWTSVNTRFTEQLAALMSPQAESAFMDTFIPRLDAIVDAAAPAMLAEGNERRRAFAEMHDSEIRQQVTDSKGKAA